MRALYKITACLPLKNQSAKHKQVKDCMAPNGFSEKYNVDELVLDTVNVNKFEENA